MIALAADHGGFAIKEKVREFLDSQNIAYKDFGTYSEDSVNYAPLALKVANAVKSGECEKGILCCGTGIGISIAANKVTGIRAALCTNEFCAKMTRLHNDANILCMGGRVINGETAAALTKIFLETPFEGGRHAERIAEIAAIEDGTLK